MNITKSSFWAIAIIAVTSLVYANHWNNGFHFDDAHTIENNLYIRNLRHIPCFFGWKTAGCQVPAAETFSSIPSHGSYRPLVTTMLAVDYALGKGYDPFWFHLSTFIFFLFQLLMMLLFFQHILRHYTTKQQALVISGLMTIGYAVHPVNAETVNYMISRSDLISTALVFAALVVYQYFPSLRNRYLYLIPVLLGALAKPTAIMFFPLLLLYQLLFEQQVSLVDFGKWSFSQLIKNSGVAGIVCIVIYFFIQHMESGYFEAGGKDKAGYWLTQPAVWLHYLSQFILPVQLSADTDWAVFPRPLPAKAWMGMAYSLLLLGAALWFSRSHKLRPLTFGILWFFVCLVPTSAVPLAEVLNDHRMFFPFAGFIMVFGWGLWLLYEQLAPLGRKFLLLLVGLMITGYGLGSMKRNTVWKTEESLWKDVTEKSPKNGRGWMNYGLTLMGKGAYPEAEGCFRKGLEFCPAYSYIHVNLGIVRAAQGDIAEAESFFKSGISLSEGSPNPLYYYARFLHEQKRIAEAIPLLEKAYSLSSAHQYTRDLLIQLYFESGKKDACRQLAESTLQLEPGQPTATKYLGFLQSGGNYSDSRFAGVSTTATPEAWLQLSLEYYQQGQYEKCIEAAKKALELRPDYAEAWNNICSGYNSLQRYEEGAAACREALRIQPNYQLAKNNLKWAEQNAR